MALEGRQPDPARRSSPTSASRCARARSSASAASSAPAAPMWRAPSSASRRPPAAPIEVNGKPVDHPRARAGHRPRARLRARGPRRRRHLPHPVGRAEHHRRGAPADRAAAASSGARSKRRWRRDSAVEKLRIRLASLRQPIGELSGGNQQKAILARWLLTDPSVLILDEPTRGIDIGVKAEFYDMIGELAAERPGHPADLVRTARAAGAVRPRPGDVGGPAHRRYRRAPRRRRKRS